MQTTKRPWLVVFCALIATPAFAQGGWVSFADETSLRLVCDPSVGTSDFEEKEYAFGDVDHDGDLDIACVRKEPFTTAGRRRNVLFMNEGIADGRPVDGVFVDRTSTKCVLATDGGQGFLDLTNDRDVQFVDVNNDTWLDMVTAVTISEGLPKTISHPRIYMNLGMSGGVWQGFRYEEARFPQITNTPGGTQAPGRFCSVAFGDVTGDGFADLYFGDYDTGPGAEIVDLNDKLFINDGAGNFTDSYTTRMTAQMLSSAFGMASVIADMNGDGVKDVVRDTALNDPRYVSISYNNPANVGFFDRFSIVYTNSPYHVTVADLNNDTKPDLVVTDDGQDGYLLNQGNNAQGVANWTTHILQRQTGTDGQFGGDHAIADMNNDGFLDVIVTDCDIDAPGCTRGAHMFRNLGNMPTITLQEQGTPVPWMPNGIHDAAVFDFSGDGWNDMFLGLCTGTQIWVNQPPVDLVFTFPDGLPGSVTPDTPTTFRVRVTGSGAQPQPGTGKQYVSIDGAPFVESNMAPDAQANTYIASLPAVPCTSTVRFYFTVRTMTNILVDNPDGTPTNSYSALSSLGTVTIVDEKFETSDPNWTVFNHASLTTGGWVRVNPVGAIFPVGSGNYAQPEDDFGAATSETMCWITGQASSSGTNAANSDVDGGPTILTSPAYDISNADAVVSFVWRHFSNTGGISIPDPLRAEITANGTDWVLMAQTFGNFQAGPPQVNTDWQAVSFKVSDFITPSATVRVRFYVDDTPNNSTTKSAVDNFKLVKITCPSGCTTDAECADGVFCNGVEVCSGGDCLPGPAACAEGDICDEDNSTCIAPLQPAAGQAALGLSTDELTRFNTGRTKFDQVFQAPQGLGPVFNQNACGACHNAGSLGGAGTITVTRFGAQGKDDFDSLEIYGGSLRQAEAISLGCAEVIPPEANIIAQRITNATFGAGLVEAIPDADIVELATNPPAGISGVAHMVAPLEQPAPLRVGRFGWKAQVATVLTFSGDASLNEMGITNRLVMTENDPNGIRPPDLATCDTVPDPEDGPEGGVGGAPHFIDRVTDFQRFLAPPPQTPKSGMSGEAIFNSTGCADCHKASYTTGTAPESALSGKTIRPYSDFLLHDMGGNADGIGQGDAGITELRSPALWGLRLRPNMWHDGRVNTGTFNSKVRAAITLHGDADSEALAAATAFGELSTTDQDKLIAFLDSLGRREFDGDGDNVVTVPDLETLGDCYTGEVYTYGPDDACSIFDPDQDGDVDDFDVQRFMTVYTGSQADCNGNSTSDALDLLNETSKDCNHNGVPDECDPDSTNVALFVAQLLSSSPSQQMICLFDGTDDNQLDGRDAQPFVNRYLAP